MYLRSHQRNKDGKHHRSFTVVETRRLSSGKTAQRRVFSFGGIHDTQQEAWRKTLEVFDESVQQFRSISLFPEDRNVPGQALESVQVQLSEMELHNARAFGDCWVGGELWRQLRLDEFWSDRLGHGREAVPWSLVLQLLAVNRLIDPGSEFRLHRHWFDQTAMADLLYRCLDQELAEPGVGQHVSDGVSGCLFPTRVGVNRSNSARTV